MLLKFWPTYASIETWVFAYGLVFCKMSQRQNGVAVIQRERMFVLTGTAATNCSVTLLGVNKIRSSTSAGGSGTQVGLETAGCQKSNWIIQRVRISNTPSSDQEKHLHTGKVTGLWIEVTRSAAVLLKCDACKHIHCRSWRASWSNRKYVNPSIIATERKTSTVELLENCYFQGSSFLIIIRLK